MTLFTSSAITANETRVGGTSRFSNEPDIESLPPIAANFNALCTRYAPSRALNGLPQRLESVRSFSKNSWNDSLILW